MLLITYKMTPEFSIRFILDDQTFVEGSESNITIRQEKKKTTVEVTYFFNTTSETVPQVEYLVQTEYQEADIGT